jgi:hypothetical protein
MVDVSMLCTSKYAVREESLPVAVVCVSCSQERGYVVKSGRTLVPTPLGRLLTAYLTIHFTEYVDVNFTAKVEEQLDEVSGAVTTFCVRGVGGCSGGVGMGAAAAAGAGRAGRQRLISQKFDGLCVMAAS